MPANNTESLKKQTRELTIKEIEKKFGKGPHKLNIGCGSDVRKGYVNIDCIEYDETLHGNKQYLQLDLEVGRLPFPKGSVEEIRAMHIMEHLHSFPKLMNECHRVMKPGGSLYINVPCYPSSEAFQDPTHVRFFTEKTLMYFIQGAFLYEHVGKSYGYEPWRRLGQQRINGWELSAKIDR